jgi:hypothetical protein
MNMEKQEVSLPPVVHSSLGKYAKLRDQDLLSKLALISCPNSLSSLVQTRSHLNRKSFGRVGYELLKPFERFMHVFTFFIQISSSNTEIEY